MGNEKTIRVTKGQLRRLIREELQEASLPRGWDPLDEPGESEELEFSEDLDSVIPTTSSEAFKLAKAYAAKAKNVGRESPEFGDYIYQARQLYIKGRGFERDEAFATRRVKDFQNPPKYQGRLIRPGDMFVVTAERFTRDQSLALCAYYVSHVDDASEKKTAQWDEYEVEFQLIMIYAPDHPEFSEHSEVESTEDNSTSYRKFEEYLEESQAKLVSNDEYARLRRRALHDLASFQRRKHVGRSAKKKKGTI